MAQSILWCEALGGLPTQAALQEADETDVLAAEGGHDVCRGWTALLTLGVGDEPRLALGVEKVLPARALVGHVSGRGSEDLHDACELLDLVLAWVRVKGGGGGEG